MTEPTYRLKSLEWSPAKYRSGVIVAPTPWGSYEIRHRPFSTKGRPYQIFFLTSQGSEESVTADLLSSHEDMDKAMAAAWTEHAGNMQEMLEEVANDQP